jgi:hypothetical protein
VHFGCIERRVSPEIEKLIVVTVLSDYIQSEKFINKHPEIKYDVLLLDRDCYLGGSFHTIDFTNFDIERIISISSILKWNKEAKKRGVKTVVYKDFDDHPYFAKNIEKRNSENIRLVIFFRILRWG